MFVRMSILIEFFYQRRVIRLCFSSEYIFVLLELRYRDDRVNLPIGWDSQSICQVPPSMAA